MMCVLPVYVYLHVGITYKHNVSGVMCPLKLTSVAQLAATLVYHTVMPTCLYKTCLNYVYNIIVCVCMTYCVFACLQTKLESGTTGTAALFAELLLFVSYYKYTYMYNMNSSNSSNNAMVPVLPRSRSWLSPDTKKYENTYSHTDIHNTDIHNTLTHTTHTQSPSEDGRGLRPKECI